MAVGLMTTPRVSSSVTVTATSGDAYICCTRRRLTPWVTVAESSSASPSCTAATVTAWGSFQFSVLKVRLLGVAVTSEVVRGVVDRHCHVAAGLVAQDNGVGVAAPLRDSELQVRHRHPKLQDGGVRRHGDHGHYHIVRIERGVLRVVGAAHPVGQGDLRSAGIPGGPDRHLLLRVPVPGAEGQRVRGAQPAQLQVRAGLARHRDRHVPSVGWEPRTTE